jgi:uncharacterized Tic20 family protein
MSQGLPADEPFGGQPPAFVTSDEKMWGMFCHLSSLLGYFAGVFSFVGPLVCWLVKRDTSRFVDYHGKESLNFQLNILIYLLLTIPIVIATCGVGAVLTIAVALYGIIMPIVAGLKANSGEMYRYPLTFRIIQ